MADRAMIGDKAPPTDERSPKMYLRRIGVMALILASWWYWESADTRDSAFCAGGMFAFAIAQTRVVDEWFKQQWGPR